MKQRLADNISVVARSPGLDANSIEVVITTPTFRRPDHLLKTLESLRAQETARPYALVVMENEAKAREGAKAAAPLFESGHFHGFLIVAHDRGNCNAYNAGWLTALVAFPAMRHLLVIDDDEIAGPDWIERMVSTAEAYDAAFVGGPQRPVFEDGGVEKWRNHPVFRAHYDTTGPVPILYSSGNLLVSRRVLEVMPQPFMDLRFNFMGGGDSDLMHRARKKGFTFAWCEEAPVFETIPGRRVSWNWIQARAMRNGVISALVHKRDRGGDGGGFDPIVFAKSLALLGLSPLRFVGGLTKGETFLGALNPVLVALGRVLSEFGYANEQYRAPEKN
ncbi:MAG TPA: glycosyltransferase [Rhizobiaceae bacterium]|nr:glycosyltransferase [Rhizobiaceae bacterium]